MWLREPGELCRLEKLAQIADRMVGAGHLDLVYLPEAVQHGKSVGEPSQLQLGRVRNLDVARALDAVDTVAALETERQDDHRADRLVRRRPVPRQVGGAGPSVMLLIGLVQRVLCRAHD